MSGKKEANARDRPLASELTKEQWQALRDEYGAVLRVSDATGYREATIRRYWREHGIEWNHSSVKMVDRKDPQNVTEDEEAPEFLDLAVGEGDIDELTDAIVELQAQITKRDPRQDDVTIRLPGSLPVGFTPRADFHVGNVHTDYKAIQRHNKLIRDTPGLYTGMCGDAWDNYIDPKKTGAREALLSPPVQEMFIRESCVAYLRHKVLFFEDGCHEAWSNAAAMFRPVENLVRGLSGKGIKTAYLGHGGRMTLLVGKQKYVIDTRHKGRGHSMYHYFQSILRSQRDDNDHEDLPHITVHAHTHESGHIKMWFRAAWRLGVKPGSYKPTDDYARKGGWARSIPSMPVIILFPDRHEIQVIDNLDLGAQVLSRLRESVST